MSIRGCTHRRSLINHNCLVYKVKNQKTCLGDLGFVISAETSRDVHCPAEHADKHRFPIMDVAQFVCSSLGVRNLHRWARNPHQQFVEMGAGRVAHHTWNQNDTCVGNDVLSLWIFLKSYFHVFMTKWNDIGLIKQQQRHADECFRHINMSWTVESRQK